jgi:hypothetical protein
MTTTSQNNELNGHCTTDPNGAASIPTRHVAATAIDVERAKSSLTFKEVVAPGLTVEVELRRILAGPVQSKYQKVEILDTYFGKVNSAVAI